MIYLYYLMSDDDVMYVGLTDEKRLNSRRADHRRRRAPHTFKVIKEFETADEARLAEQEHISLHDTYRDMSKWNKSPGGDYLAGVGFPRKGIGGRPKGTTPWNKGLKGDPRCIDNGKKVSKTRKERNNYVAWNKGIPATRNPMHDPEVRLAYAKKVTGRKMAKREDGSRYWIYPHSDPQP